MSRSVTDSRLQAAALHFLREYPQAPARALGSHLDLVPPTCYRLLDILMHAGAITWTLADPGRNRGPRAKLYSVVSRPVHWIKMPPAAFAEEMRLLLAAQPWPVWMLLPRPGERIRPACSGTRIVRRDS